MSNRKIILLVLLVLLCISIISYFFMSYVLAYNDGDLLKSNNDVKVYLIHNNQKRWIQNIKIFESYNYDWNTLRIVSPDILLNIPDNKLIQASTSPDIYFIDKGYKRHILTPEVFDSYNYDWNNISIINDIELGSYATSTLIKIMEDDKVYHIDANNIKHWIPTIEVFYKNNYNWDELQVVNNTDLNSYITGENIGIIESEPEPIPEEPMEPQNNTPPVEEPTPPPVVTPPPVEPEPELPPVEEPEPLISSMNIYKDGLYLVIENTGDTILKIKKLKVVSNYSSGIFTAIIHFPNSPDNAYQYHMENQQANEFTDNIANIIPIKFGRNYNNLDIDEIEPNETAKIDIGLSTTNPDENTLQAIVKIEYQEGSIVDKTTEQNVEFQDVNY